MVNKKQGIWMLLSFLVLLTPVVLISSNVNLANSVSDEFGFFMSLLTDSAGHKGFILTLFILTIVTLRLRLTRREFLAKYIQLAVILLIGFASKTGLKTLTESPRPYSEFMTEKQLVESPQAFYLLDPLEKANMIDEASRLVSQWKTRHWQAERDYSFPSGHTIFAAICIAFFAGLFCQYGQYGSAVMVLVWGGGVAFSRLWIGMHRPEDLFASVVFVGIVYLITPSFLILADKVDEALPSWWFKYAK